MLMSDAFDLLFGTACGDTFGDKLENYTKTNGSDKQDAFFTLLNHYGFDRIEAFKGRSFKSAGDVFDFYSPYFIDKEKEEFHAVILDNKHRVMDTVQISVGTKNQSFVHPRETFQKAVEKRAASIILIHNHPSGDPQPSNQDTKVTKRLIEAGEILGIKVLDHVIMTSHTFFSFVDHNLI